MADGRQGSPQELCRDWGEVKPQGEGEIEKRSETLAPQRAHKESPHTYVHKATGRTRFLFKA